MDSLCQLANLYDHYQASSLEKRKVILNSYWIDSHHRILIKSRKGAFLNKFFLTRWLFRKSCSLNLKKNLSNLKIELQKNGGESVKKASLLVSLFANKSSSKKIQHLASELVVRANHFSIHKNSTPVPTGEQKPSPRFFPPASESFANITPKKKSLFLYNTDPLKNKKILSLMTKRLHIGEIKIGAEYFKPNDDLRYQVRDRTAKRVIKSLFGKSALKEMNVKYKAYRIHTNEKGKAGQKSYLSFLVKKNFFPKIKPKQISPAIREAIKQVRLHIDPLRDGAFRSCTQILGRFDILRMPCLMDYDDHWNLHQKNNLPFYVFHGAAINIGENGDAEDFVDYQNGDGSLDINKYIQDMGIIFENMLKAQWDSQVSDAVWFPFGMGAYLRNLWKVDPSFKDPSLDKNDDAKLWELRQKIAEEFFKKLSNFPKLRIHLCLPEIENDIPTNQNCSAFIRALLKQKKTIRSQVRLYINEDATHLAQKLANQSKAYQVGLVNGGNRNLIGNHWFDDFAKTAIDENLTRRSIQFATLAFLLNGGASLKERENQEGYLINRIKIMQKIF